MPKQPKLKKINRDKWRYELLDNYTVFLSKNPGSLYAKCEHPYFSLLAYPDANVKLTIRRGYAWDGATGLPDLLQTTDLQAPSLIHDVFCQATNEDLISWNPWRLFGDQEFKKLYHRIKEKSFLPHTIRLFVLYSAIRANSIWQGLVRVSL